MKLNISIGDAPYAILICACPRSSFLLPQSAPYYANTEAKPEYGKSFCFTPSAHTLWKPSSAINESVIPPCILSQAY